MSNSNRAIAFFSYGLLFATFPLIIFLGTLSKPKSNLLPLNSTSTVFNDWRDCVLNNADKMANESFIKWPTVLAHCEKDLLFNLKINEFKWHDNTVRLAYDKENMIEPTIVGFGNGLDEKEIKKVHQVLRHNRTKFFGGFPLDDASQKRFEASTGLYEFSVPIEIEKPSSVLDSTYSGYFGSQDFANFILLNKEIKLIDALWLDFGAREEEILPFALKGGFFDRRGITVCQIHSHIHHGQNIDKLSTLIHKIVAEGKYAIVKPFPPGLLINSHFPLSISLTLYMINLENPICKQRHSKATPL